MQNNSVVYHVFLFEGEIMIISLYIWGKKPTI